jgi:hypothetical protein
MERKLILLSVNRLLQNEIASLVKAIAVGQNDCSHCLQCAETAETAETAENC